MILDDVDNTPDAVIILFNKVSDNYKYTCPGCGTEPLLPIVFASMDGDKYIAYCNECGASLGEQERD